MSPSPTRLAVAVCAAFAAAGSARAQAWDTYSYPDAGFVVQFPAQPRVDRGAWRTAAGLDVPAAIYAARLDRADYVVTIADFSGTALDKDAAIADAVTVVARGDRPVADVEARINTRYGREVSFAGQDGAWTVTAVFFFNQKLYVLEGRASGPNGKDASGRLIRFQQSLQFPGP